MSDNSAQSSDRQQTAALIRQYLEAFNRKDQAAILECMSQDVIHDVNQGERRAGKEKFVAFLERMAHCYDEKLEDVVVMVSRDGKRAAAEFNVVGTYLKTDAGLPEANGQTYRLPAGVFFAVSNGKIARVTTYYNLTDWIAQVAG